jgi:hypothetical protein
MTCWGSPGIAGGSGMISKTDVKTVVLPWYRKDDFASLCYGEQSASGLEQCYDRWQCAAQAAASRHLAAGFAVELVSIEPKEFATWLEDECRDDCVASRIEFISQLVARSCGVKSQTTAQ